MSTRTNRSSVQHGEIVSERPDGRPRVFCLCRISSNRKVSRDVSVPEQKAAARKYKKENLSAFRWGEGCYPETEPAGFFVDRAVSAWKNKFNVRPASSNLLSQLVRGDYVLIYSVDRGFRNVADFGETLAALSEAGINVIFVSQPGVNLTSASGKMIGNMLASIAQYSSDIKSERMREARAIRKHGIQMPSCKERPRDDTPWAGTDLKLPDNFFGLSDSTDIPGRVFGYVRCSHITSLDSGLGLASQREGVSDYTRRLIQDNPLLTRGELHEDDAVSAFSIPFAKRPSGRKLTSQLRKGDHVVVYRLDRAWRSLKDSTETIEKWIADGIHVHIVCDGARSDSPLGRIHFYTMSYVSWIESYMLSVRMKSIADYKRSRGIPPSSPKRGFGVKKSSGIRKLVIDLDEMARHRYIHEMKERTGLSFEDMSDEIEKWEAAEEGRRIRPISGPNARYWGRRKIQEYYHRYPELKKIAEMNDLEIPTPYSLHERGVLIQTPKARGSKRRAARLRQQKEVYKLNAS